MAKKENITGEFVNPFIEGITYETFLNAIPTGVTIKEYLKDFTNDEINFIENEVNNYKLNKKYK